MLIMVANPFVANLELLLGFHGVAKQNANTFFITSVLGQLIVEQQSCFYVCTANAWESPARKPLQKTNK